MTDSTPRRGVTGGDEGDAARRGSGDATHPVPRRSATSPTEWNRWNDEDDDLPVVPSRSARLVDSVPPPLPAMPRRSGATPVSQVSAAGRRYDPRALPEDYQRAEPRRSATSPSQWRAWDDDEDAPASYRSGSAPAPATNASGSTAAGEAHARRPWWIWLLLGLLVLALVAGALVVGMMLGDHQTASGQGTDAAQLVSEADAGRIGGTWNERSTDNPASAASSAPTCLSGDSAGLTDGDQSAARNLSSASGLSLVHRYQVYETEAKAERAYASLVQEVGGCGSGPVAHLDQAWSLGGLGNDAVVVQVTQQEQRGTGHQLALLRVGRAVNVVDVASPGAKAPDPGTLMALLTPLVERQCKPMGGSCATQTTPVEIAVPTSDQPGFLVPADLPRITPGVGRWSSAPAVDQVTTPGSGCEAAPLATLPDVKKASQRTFGLSGDPKAPSRFGIDEVVLQFATPDAANRVSRLLVQNIARCGSRTKNATIPARDHVDSQLGNGTAITGTSFEVRAGQARTIPYRVAVMTVDTRVVYLLLTPTTDYTMAKEDWLALASRAGDRALQLP